MNGASAGAPVDRGAEQPQVSDGTSRLRAIANAGFNQCASERPGQSGATTGGENDPPPPPIPTGSSLGPSGLQKYFSIGERHDEAPRSPHSSQLEDWVGERKSARARAEARDEWNRAAIKHAEQSGQPGRGG